MHEPLYTADEMREAEARYPGYPETAPELMERAGAAVAREAMRAFPRARRFAVVCGGGSNGGDGRIAARVLREAGRDAVETNELDGADVVIDALFGTGFHGEPRPEAAALDRADERCGCADRRGRHPVRRGRLDGRDRRPLRSRPRSPSRFTGGRSASLSRRVDFKRDGWSWRTSGWSRSRRTRSARRNPCSGTCRAGRRTIRSTRQAACSSSAARRE